MVKYEGKQTVDENICCCIQQSSHRKMQYLVSNMVVIDKVFVLFFAKGNANFRFKYAFLYCFQCRYE